MQKFLAVLLLIAFETRSSATELNKIIISTSEEMEVAEEAEEPIQVEDKEQEQTRVKNQADEEEKTIKKEDEEDKKKRTTKAKKQIKTILEQKLYNKKTVKQLDHGRISSTFNRNSLTGRQQTKRLMKSERTTSHNKQIKETRTKDQTTIVFPEGLFTPFHCWVISELEAAQFTQTMHVLEKTRKTIRQVNVDKGCIVEYSTDRLRIRL